MDKIWQRYNNLVRFATTTNRTSNFSISPIMIIFAVTNLLHQDNELSEEATTEDFSVVQQEGQREVQRIDSDFDKMLRDKR